MNRWMKNYGKKWLTPPTIAPKSSEIECIRLNFIHTYDIRLRYIRTYMGGLWQRMNDQTTNKCRCHSLHVQIETIPIVFWIPWRCLRVWCVCMCVSKYLHVHCMCICIYVMADAGPIKVRIWYRVCVCKCDIWEQRSKCIHNICRHQTIIRLFTLHESPMSHDMWH